MRAMNPYQKRAVEYCLSIGADPYEIVWGYWPGQWGSQWTSFPRYCWYQHP